MQSMCSQYCRYMIHYSMTINLVNLGLHIGGNNGGKFCNFPPKTLCFYYIPFSLNS